MTSDLRTNLAMSLAIGGLVLKRKQIAQRIHQEQYDLRKLAAELDAIDDAIRAHDPEQPSVSIKTPRAFCGQVKLVVMGLLRGSGPLTSRELALGVMRERGLPSSDLKLVRTMIQRVNLSLHAMQRRNEVVRIDGGELIRWALSGPQRDPGESA